MLVKKRRVHSHQTTRFLHIAEMAKSLVLGMSVFGTYEYLVYHFTNDHDAQNDESPSFSPPYSTPVLIHAASGACAE